MYVLVVVVSVYLGVLCSYILRRHQAYLGLGLFVAHLYLLARKFGKPGIFPMSRKALSWRESDKLVSSKSGKPEAHLVQFPQVLSL
jgi:hypothetical protein